MNDYASIILYVMRDESLAYICFCSIMKRIRANFATDGVAIATKLHHLKVLLQAIDPVYWNFLESCDAGINKSKKTNLQNQSINLLFLVNLYFTYRWLLLECKREFPFNDALRVLEVMWATLPIDSEPPQLSEVTLITSPSDTMIADILCPIPCRLSQRRVVSCPQLSIIDESNSRIYKHRSSSVTYYNKEQLLSALEKQQQQQQSDCTFTLDNDEYQCSSFSNTTTNSTYTSSREKSLGNSFSLSEISEFDTDNLSSSVNTNNPTGTTTNSQSLSTTNWLQRLPAGDTTWLDEDNLFLHFVCISILLAHRNFLLKQTNLDEQEISIHFDRYRRRHNAERILSYARTFYAQYIQ